MTDQSKPAIEYEERLLTFIDLCGFKGIIEQTVVSDGGWSAEDLYCLLKEFTGDVLESEVIGNVPTLGVDRSKKLKPIDELDGLAKEKAYKESKAAWPISITHFSDSFVISTPSTNKGSTVSHFLLVRGLVRALLRKGITVRGGMTVGKVIHESAGVLFGPAMNRAYQLESGASFAQWPRILMDASAYLVFIDAFPSGEALHNLVQRAESEFWQITPASCAFSEDPEGPDAQLLSNLKSLHGIHKSDPKLGPRYAELLKNWNITHEPN